MDKVREPTAREKALEFARRNVPVPKPKVASKASKESGAEVKEPAYEDEPVYEDNDEGQYYTGMGDTGTNDLAE